MATKKTNNEEALKKTSAAKKTARTSKTVKKQEDSKKKTSAKVKKAVSKKNAESKTVKKNTNSVKKTKENNKNSRTIKKLEPIKTDNNMENKPERESIKLLREAIKAKSRNISKPVAVKKHLIVKEDNDNSKDNNKTASSSILNKSEAENVKSADFVFSRFEKKEETLNDNNDSKEVKEFKEFIEKKTEEKKSEVQTFSKNTYSKSDIFKKPVIVKSSAEDEELKKNIEDSKFNQSEIDDAIENAAMIDEDTPIEDYSAYSSKKLEELKRKDIKIIETEEEMKSSEIPQIERKPAEPYAVPPHSSIKKEKKSNKLVAIIGIIVIILGLSYLGFQFFGNKSSDFEDDFYNTPTNENIISTNEAEQDINNLQTNDIENLDNLNNLQNATNNAEIQQTNIASEISDITEVSNNNINNNNNIVQADTNIAPVRPDLPNPPVIPAPPSNPTAQNTSAYLGGSVYRTKWTDTLSSIASSELGDSRRWPTIYVMNENIFEDPDSLVFNKDIRIPEGSKKKIEDMTAEEKRALYNDYIRVSQAYLNMGKTNSANALRNRADSIIK